MIDTRWDDLLPRDFAFFGWFVDGYIRMLPFWKIVG
jgi:hypothetical protein